MVQRRIQVVTGAFGYSGRYITRRLLEAGHRVRTLTNSPARANPFGREIEVHPLCFDDAPRLRPALSDADTLYNTYWVRFNHRLFTYAQAVDNSLRLFQAAREAAVRRIVHISITNPSLDSPFEYFQGKAQLERALVDSGLSYAILRPAVLFGHEDILINNIAWMLRRLPVFGVFGDGLYRLRPIHVDDLAALAVEQGESTADATVDAVGPEAYTFRDLVLEIAAAIGKRRPIVRVPPALGSALGWALGRILGDVVITRDEIGGLMAGLLDSDAPSAGPTRLSAWAREHADRLGVRYARELARRTNRRRAYAEL